MRFLNWFIPTVATAALTIASASTAFASPETDYDELVQMFDQFRAMTGAGAGDFDAMPVVAPEAIAAEAIELARFQTRLRAIDSSSWPVPRQIDYHLVRAEMNGLEFKHRVTRPWFRDPGTYSDVVLFLGERLSPSPDGDELSQIHATLKAIPTLFAHAIENLQKVDEIPSDLADLAIRDLRNGAKTLDKLDSIAGSTPANFHSDVREAAKANSALLDWLELNRPRMTAAAGVGRENYNWLLKNVYLFPYTWEELRTIVELEDNRVITFQKLEENRNRAVPAIEPVQSQAEYKASVADAIDDIMSFLKREEIFTMPDYLTPDEYFGSWHGFENPWPDHHDYFFNFSHREPRMEEAHEMVGHHFDQLRGQNNKHPIRKGWRPYKISTARTEGFAFALEELLMHAGYLQGISPRAREIAYEQSAFRTVRALSDIYMHDNQWNLRDAMKFSVANAPHGHLLDNSPHLWFEMATTLRGVGHHMLMVVGKVQFMKLMRDSAQQRGSEFTVASFMDEFFESGLIPMALIRWEMTGRDDEVRKLW
ncbi:MAG: hypothetical protein ACI9G1_004022 [Pirellulaceae bacterium]|jgi:uncharacterized protein (DUF885 family)